MIIFASIRKLFSGFTHPYIILNIVYYGLIVCGMVYISFNPSLRQALMENVKGELGQGLFSPVVSAYKNQALRAIVLTFLVNLILGCFVTITLPSLAIPFCGLGLGALRAILWGLIFSPIGYEISKKTIISGLLILILIILEGQAYVLAMLGVYIHSKAFIWPHQMGLQSHSQGYRLGLRRSVQIYPLIAIVLAVAAGYEVLMTRFIISPLH